MKTILTIFFATFIIIGCTKKEIELSKSETVQNSKTSASKFRGTTKWMPEKLISTQQSVNSTTGIAVYEDFIHVVWNIQSTDPKGYKVVYKRSSDGGKTWEEEQEIFSNNSAEPLICNSNQSIYIACGNSLKYSSDNGQNWSSDIRFKNSNVYITDIIASEENLHVISVSNNGNGGISYTKSTNKGLNWDKDIVINDSPFNGSPKLSVFNSFIHLVWQYHTLGVRYEEGQVFYKHSTNNGLNWEPTIELTNGIESGMMEPTMTVSGMDVHVAWDGETGIYYRQSSDGGVDWVAEKNLSKYPGLPFITSNDKNLHIVWSNGLDGTEYAKLFYKSSSDGGITWEKEIVLNSNKGNAYSPILALNGTSIHLVWTNITQWTETTIGNHEIYYKGKIEE